eukprot:30732-Amphidinium_carterae.1
MAGSPLPRFSHVKVSLLVMNTIPCVVFVHVDAASPTLFGIVAAMEHGLGGAVCPLQRLSIAFACLPQLWE